MLSDGFQACKGLVDRSLREIYIVSLEVSSFNFDRFAACFDLVFGRFFFSIFVGQCEDSVFPLARWIICLSKGSTLYFL